MPSDTKEFSLKDHFYGAATVGERGQIVIPVAARKRYGIETGDKTFILSDSSAMEQEIASGGVRPVKTEDDAS